MEPKIYLCSDLHLFHDREFIYKPRGFQSCEEMTDCYLNYWHNTVEKDDVVIVAGDFCLGNDFNKIKEVVSSLPGKITLVIGNHDTDKKVELYKSLGIQCKWAERIKCGRKTILVSHYITETATLESDPKNCVLNAHGHLHIKNKHYEDKPFLYNVSVDANNNQFVTPEQIVESFKQEVKKCIELL